MEIRSDEIDGILHIYLEGELDANNVNGLSELFESGRAKGINRIIFDLSRLEYIDSSGLGALVKRLKVARQEGGDLKIAAPAEDIRKVFELTRLDRVFDIRKTAEEAREQFYTVS